MSQQTWSAPRPEPPPVQYVEYDANYPTVFQRLKDLVHSVLPGRRIEHVGSTSVPGLGGRGVVDTVLIGRAEEHERLVEVLKHVGFRDFPYGALRPGLRTSIHVAERDYPVVLYAGAHRSMGIPASKDTVCGGASAADPERRSSLRRGPRETTDTAGVQASG